MIILADKPVPRTVGEIRSSAARWRQLDAMLASLQRLAQINAILDAGRGVRNSIMQAAEFEGEADEMEQMIDAELSTLTVELLTVELQQKKMRDRK